MPFVAAFGLIACEPTFNWREARLAETAFLAMMPCKPETMTRQVPFVLGQIAQMTVSSCEAGGVTFAMSTTEIEDAQQSARALGLWREAMQKHWQFQPAAQQGSQPLDLPRATYSPQAVRIKGRGHQGGGDGQDIFLESAFFAQGSRVFQVALIGRSSKALNPELVDTFFSGLKLQ